ncbi:MULTISPECIES: J domain-containing protein [Actinomadura]|uniref:J domain-containing protein n=1 Tax=Actinomadura yumaensis TaxID=111807 RepID=A0ABW2CTD9_9ACTN|nr:J domain-containing protein [Actinomadura sp. J1-007]MWK37753.1 DnaJ domain-containing protein [Actinomadura sp. J1-007]
MPREFAELAGNDAYELLGVPPDATQAEIKRAHRELIRKHHPDKHQDPAGKAAAEESTRLLNSARDILVRRRASYDAFRTGPAEDPDVADGEALIDDPWETAAHGRAPRPPPPPPPPPPPRRPPYVPHPRPTPPPPRYVWPPPPPPRRRPRRVRKNRGWVAWLAFWALVALLGVPAARLLSEPVVKVAVPAKFAGSWSGTVKKAGTKGEKGEESADLTLYGGKEVGEVSYRNGRCNGKAIPLTLEADTLTVRTDFPNHGPECAVATMHISVRKRDEAKVVCYTSGQGTRWGAGVLRRS